MNKFLEFILDTLSMMFMYCFYLVITGFSISLVALPVYLLLRSLGLPRYPWAGISLLCGTLAFFILFNFLTRDRR